MTVYNDIYNLKSNADVRNRMAVAIAKISLDIMAESAGTANHANRVIWAKTAILGPEGMTDRLFWACMLDATLRTKGDTATDAEIQTAVDAAVNNFAIG